MSRLIFAAALMAACAGPASAGLFPAGDLGAMTSSQACMTAAKNVLESYLDKYAGGSVVGDTQNPESRVVYGLRLRPGDNDIVISCPVVSSQVNAFISLYSRSENARADADIVIARVRELWNRHD